MCYETQKMKLLKEKETLSGLKTRVRYFIKQFYASGISETYNNTLYTQDQLSHIPLS